MNIAYLAGLLDGEGYIGIERSPKGSYSVRMQLIMTCPITINLIKGFLENLGLSVYYWDKRVPKKGHKQNILLRVSGCKDMFVLSSLMAAHSITKKRQWELVQGFCERRVPYSSYDELDHKIYAELRKLNMRGTDEKITV